MSWTTDPFSHTDRQTPFWNFRLHHCYKHSRHNSIVLECSLASAGYGPSTVGFAALKRFCQEPGVLTSSEYTLGIDEYWGVNISPNSCKQLRFATKTKVQTSSSPFRSIYIWNEAIGCNHTWCCALIGWHTRISGGGVVKVRRKEIRHRVKLWGMTIHGGVI